ncbi:hypothetical protein PTSG_12177 [Salpingoeca rosetta]|uniref:Golgi SNAP receptor complex member 1 n=1 Tax=Salpingoeca rosetta (strain ATCC 50818 / BSB-021) TaxID=946362 RepID=F2U8L7_SALR5|nr:uncharacterized protein PTSG_12177 [Salpingoeca rosetta]EGD72725.1 hypothetical protein PTSG_12177 [Salpingoeca rosetta]|eukprot:XP_004994548.1 hypothetical protein PTSG_12177 [Salpingoeca rosetta]
MATGSSPWEAKHLRVRQLELELEANFEKLRNFNQLKRSDDPLRDIHSVYAEIQNCLDEFSVLTSEMVGLAGEARSRVTVVNQLAQKETAYHRQFARIKQSIKAQMEKEDLLDNVKKTINDHHSGSRNEDLYLKESDHIRTSDRLTDDILGMAAGARNALQDQASRIDNVFSKLSTTMNKFPVINQLSKNIDLRKKRSAIILGSVIATCVVFSLWYIMY